MQSSQLEVGQIWENDLCSLQIVLISSTHVHYIRLHNNTALDVHNIIPIHKDRFMKWITSNTHLPALVSTKSISIDTYEIF